MKKEMKKPAPLSFKPDLDDAAKRWNAFYEGEIIDRPIVCVRSPKDGYEPAEPINVCDYRDKVFGDTDALIDKVLKSTEATFFGGEAVPDYFPSLGPDELAVFCGGELHWSENSDGLLMTNWSKPVVNDWDGFLPIKLDESNQLWQHLLMIYRRASEKMAGKMLLAPPDLHSNMDLLSALRGPENLCMDLIDDPELIDRAMADARAVFPKIWNAVKDAGRFEENGYCNTFYSMEGAATLQCDFSCMISSEMFRRWVLPALEEEAEIVKHAMYHWDGPGALIHTDDLIASKGLHTLAYVPGEGRGRPVDYLELYKKVQAGGKAVYVWGSIDEIKFMHSELMPAKTIYNAYGANQAEADALLEWFVKNT
ncbi:MAG: uroporphyrinogen decarboxylase/cobalamine-independent methonine synthase family protein [Saccharofermentanales bacterium]